MMYLTIQLTSNNMVLFSELFRTLTNLLGVFDSSQNMQQCKFFYTNEIAQAIDNHKADKSIW